MISILRGFFAPKEDETSPLVQASYKLTYCEYGVKESDGEVVWFSDGRPEDSLPDALRYIDQFYNERLTLMKRHVSVGREVDHERFRS